MSRGIGRVQRAVLDYLATDPAGQMVWGGAPAFTGVTMIARRVFGVDAPTPAQVSSVRRAVRSLETVGLVETFRGRMGRTYTQRRQALRILTYACRGEACPWCVLIGQGGHREHRPTQMSVEAIVDRHGDDTTAAVAELALAELHGVHWWFGRRGPDHVAAYEVTIVELGARRALTLGERQEDQDAYNRFTSRTSALRE